MFYYIFSITYQKIGDLFCFVIFLDFRTVHCSVIHRPYVSAKKVFVFYNTQMYYKKKSFPLGNFKKELSCFLKEINAQLQILNVKAKKHQMCIKYI